MLLILLLFAFGSSQGRNLLRSAPRMCPIENGNLIGVELFVRGEEECIKICEDQKGCSFYRFFEEIHSKPSQCYLFNTCGRHVEPSTPDCQLSKENTIDVKPFVTSDEQCENLCRHERDCGYYKYFPEESVLNTEGNEISSDKSQFCYLLRSCAKRMVDKASCVLGKNNFLDVKFFVQSSEDCGDLCLDTEECRYYWWYPIEESDYPLYCYLFRQCAASDSEPNVALILGGRHPGHHFLSNSEHNDIVSRNDVCLISTTADDAAEIDRAGATSEYVNGSVIFCGGRNHMGAHDSCLLFNPEENVWSNHSIMLSAHEEASSATIGSVTYVIGGVESKFVEGFDLAAEEGERGSWLQGPDMPDVRGRACAVAIDDQTIVVIGGHDNQTLTPLSSVFVLNIADSFWIEDSIPHMIEPRMDHACVFVEFENTKGILVSGGLGNGNQILDSVEFYDISKGEWTLTSSLKIGRTEHAMSLVFGIPTVIGGLSSTEFLSSIEQFDKSSSSWNVPLKRDWRIINHSLNSPRYEMAVASIPASKIDACDSDIL